MERKLAGHDDGQKKHDVGGGATHELFELVEVVIVAFVGANDGENVARSYFGPEFAFFIFKSGCEESERLARFVDCRGGCELGFDAGGGFENFFYEVWDVGKYDSGPILREGVIIGEFESMGTFFGDLGDLTAVDNDTGGMGTQGQCDGRLDGLPERLAEGSGEGDDIFG